MSGTDTENPADRPTALILGASRGLGLGLVVEYLERGWRVVATVRPGGSTDVFLPTHKTHHDRLQVEFLDINRPDTVHALKNKLAPNSLDLLFVNAGVSRGPEDNVSTIATDDFMDLMVTNALSPLRAITAFSPLVNSTGTIAVMSSGLGSVSNNSNGQWEVYRASKASLNTLVRSFAARQPAQTHTYLCISPGWVKTDMGGDDAPLDITTSISGIATTIRARSGLGGVHYVDYRNEPIEW